MVTLPIVRCDYLLGNNGLPRSVHQSHELTWEPQRLRCHILARPDFGRGFRYQPAIMKGNRKSLGNGPPAYLVGDGKVVALFSAWKLLSLQYLLEEEKVVFCQIGYVDSGEILPVNLLSETE